MDEFNNVNLLTDNLLTVSSSEAEQTGPQMILNNMTFNYFRTKKAPDGSKIALYIGVSPSELREEEIGIINENYDEREGKKNRKAKNAVVRSLNKHFNSRDFQIYEFGCGNTPIINFFPEEDKPSYMGIERDDKLIAELHSMNVPVGHWNSVMNTTSKPDNKTSICISIYAMHFMVEDKFADQINHFISDDGFFTGNFYSTQEEQETHEERNKLKTILNNAGLCYFVLKQPSIDSNEYWVIGRKSSEETTHEYAEQLQETLSENKKEGFEFQS